MRIRTATALDEQPVLDLLRVDGATTGRQPSKARLLHVRGTLRSPSTLALVADDAGAVVGALVAELGRQPDGAVEPGLLHLSLLCVAPQHRRRGTGTALLAALLERFDHVSTWTSEPAAQALLSAAGFVPTGSTRTVRGAAAAQLVRTPG